MDINKNIVIIFHPFARKPPMDGFAVCTNFGTRRVADEKNHITHHLIDIQVIHGW